MDITSEHAGDAPAPKTHDEKIQAITGLINDANDIDTTPTANETDGQKVSGDDVRADNSQAGAVDADDDNAPSGVDDDPKDAEEGSTAGDGDTVTLSRLAEHLGIEPSDVYELEIPIADGKTVNLGQLKDEFKEYGPAKEYQRKLTEERETFERAQLQTRAELNAIMANIPPQMREGIIRSAREQQAQWSKEQETAVLEAIPDWQDADNRAKDRAMLVEDGAEYGFSEQEITFTQDARTLRMLRDFSRMKRELSEMRAAAKAQPGKANAPGKASPTTQSKRKLAAALQKAKADPTMQGKASVVSQLIRNQS